MVKNIYMKQHKAAGVSSHSFLKFNDLVKQPGSKKINKSHPKT